MSTREPYVIYGRDTCESCSKAVALLQRFRQPMKYKSTTDLDVLAELKQKLPDAKTVPQIWRGDKYIGGLAQLEAYVQHVHGYWQPKPHEEFQDEA